MTIAFTANDAHRILKNINQEQAVQWARVANRKLEQYIGRYPNTSPLVLKEKVVNEVSEQLVNEWK